MAALLEGQLPPATDSSLRAAVSVAVSPWLQDGSTMPGAGQTEEEAGRAWWSQRLWITLILQQACSWISMSGIPSHNTTSCFLGWFYLFCAVTFLFCPFLLKVHDFPATNWDACSKVQIWGSACVPESGWALWQSNIIRREKDRNSECCCKSRSTAKLSSISIKTSELWNRNMQEMFPEVRKWREESILPHSAHQAPSLKSVFTMQVTKLLGLQEGCN